MEFGLRFKLALPIFGSLLILIAIFHFYLAQEMLNDEKEHYFSYQYKYMEAIERVVSRLVLSGDLAELYATLDEYDTKNEEWLQIAVYGKQDKLLYPLSGLPSYEGEYIEVIERKVYGDEEPVGKLVVWLNWQEESDEIYEHIYRLEVIVFTVFVIVTILANAWLNRLVRKPIVELQEVAHKISAGNYDSRLPPATKDELGQLTRAFERMSVNLKEHEASLVLAKEVAEKASNAKSLFLTRVTHELRTPMNAILGFGQLIATDTANPLDEQHKVLIEELLSAGQHLLDLIDQVLELSKIESDEIVVRAEANSLNNILHECITMSEITANERGITFDNKIAADIKVMVDYQHFRDVILKIISNAIKYNRDNGIITITREDKPDNVKIGITDQGEGISEEGISKLFQPFERLGKENTDIRGIGLGLIISKCLLELMGGSIEIESAPGKGTTVWITIKKAV